MNLATINDPIATSNLWEDLTDRDGELISGGNRRCDLWEDLIDRYGELGSESNRRPGNNQVNFVLNLYIINNSNVLIAGRDNKLGNNAF